MRKTKKLRNNLKPTLLIMLIPIFIGAGVATVFITGRYESALSTAGNQRLLTENWQAANDEFAKRQPDYERKFAYYQLKEGQTLASVAEYFSVDPVKLKEFNPGMVVPGTTVKVPPVEHPLVPTDGPNGKINGAVIVEDGGMLRIRQDYKLERAVTTIPELMEFLEPYGAIEQTGPKTYRLNRTISLERNIRLDLTADTVTKLELRSAAHDVTCLCFDKASALLRDVAVTTYDPATGKPDIAFENERAFVRMKNGRMDAVNVDFSYLGTDLNTPGVNGNRAQPLKEGGMYGVSWRISDDLLGVEIATGWVERSRFTKNHFGAYTYGASGMMWRNNYFAHNDVYGLDPHDDSNNALVENNVFAYNGKHGFIVSKRCNYNIIRNNTSVGNKLHGFMLHQDSHYNLIENNVAYDNTDNYVIYASDYNTLRDNMGYSARSSHVRINEGSRNNFVVDNTFLGGRRGVFVYGDSANVHIADNTINVGKEVLMTEGARNVLFARNTIDMLSYKIGTGDRLIFGPSSIVVSEPPIPSTIPVPKGFTASKL